MSNSKNNNQATKPKRMRLDVKRHINSDFAEDKDWAAIFREQGIRKTLDDGNDVILDFGGISLTTQSFIHALISDILRSEGENVLKRIEFRGCTPAVRGIVETVVQYSLETTEDGGSLNGEQPPPSPS